MPKSMKIRFMLLKTTITLLDITTLVLKNKFDSSYSINVILKHQFLISNCAKLYYDIVSNRRLRHNTL